MNSSSRPPRPEPRRLSPIPKLGDSLQPETALPEEPTGSLANRRILLVVTGSVAAYKAVLLTRLLVKEGADVEVVLTKNAEKFVGAATFSAITGKPPVPGMFAAGVAGEVHVEFAARAELVLVVPATADFIARLAGGRASDLASSLLLCTRAPVLVAPAMHPNMWSHPRTQHNVSILKADGRVEFVGPVEGEVASGESGMGRMAEPETLLQAAMAQLSAKPLKGYHIVVTAGPTAEDVDPVRFVGNRSSGRMGFAIAERAALQGARVTLIAGPVDRPTPYGVERIDVRSALAMRGAIWQAMRPDLTGADALIMCAAVADYRPSTTHASKLKRSAQPLLLELAPNPDILAEIGAARQSTRPTLIGFALETVGDERLIQVAREKLAAKRVDLIFANHADESIGKQHIRAFLVSPKDAEPVPPMSKHQAADRLLAWLKQRSVTET